MPDNYYKADITAFAYKFLHELLQKTCIEDDDIDIPDRKRKAILLYCLMQKAISSEQTFIIMGNQEKKATDMVMLRLTKKGVLKKVNYGRNNKVAYCLTVMGRDESIKISRKLIELFDMGNSLSSDSNNFTLDEVIEQFRLNSVSKQPKYWSHYFATRDIYIYLLFKEDVSIQYETEVAINDGIPFTLYERVLLGSRSNYQMRCDALIKYVTERVSLRFFIEVDNGSQSPSILVDKVKKYVINYADTDNFEPETSLLFCINTTCIRYNKAKHKNYIKVTSADYHYVFAISCVCEMLKNSSLKMREDATTKEVLTVIGKISRGGQPDNKLKQLIRYFEKKTTLFDENMRVCDMHKIYLNSFKKRDNQKKYAIKAFHQDKYLSRRLSLYKSVIDIPELQNAFLKGFSLLTVANYDFDSTFNYLNLRMTDHWINVIMMLLTVGYLRSVPVYKPYIYIESNNVLRNYYAARDSDLGAVIENVTDDLGGYYRILSLLNREDIPQSLFKTKVICIGDSRSIDDIKEKYSKTNMGIKLSKLTTKDIGDDFDVLFATYEDVFNKGNFSFLHPD